MNKLVARATIVAVLMVGNLGFSAASAKPHPPAPAPSPKPAPPPKPTPPTSPITTNVEIINCMSSGNSIQVCIANASGG